MKIAHFPIRAVLPDAESPRGHFRFNIRGESPVVCGHELNTVSARAVERANPAPISASVPAAAEVRASPSDPPGRRPPDAATASGTPGDEAIAAAPHGVVSDTPTRHHPARAKNCLSENI